MQVLSLGWLFPSAHHVSTEGGIADVKSWVAGGPWRVREDRTLSSAPGRGGCSGREGVWEPSEIFACVTGLGPGREKGGER